MSCFELYQRIAAENEDVLVDSEFLVSQGRCYLALGDKVAAEECFIAAIEGDDDNIDARFELAKIYEGEQEKEGREEAFLLVNEALSLEAQHGEEGSGAAAAAAAAATRRVPRKLAPVLAGRKRRGAALLKSRERRYRPRRLGGSEERRKRDQERAAVLGEKYRMCVDLKQRQADGETGDRMQDVEAWMELASELIEDFRSSKDFYPWDKYVKSQGFVTVFAGQQMPPNSNAQLMAMATRLQQSKFHVYTLRITRLLFSSTPASTLVALADGVGASLTQHYLFKISHLRTARSLHHRPYSSATNTGGYHSMSGWIFFSNMLSILHSRVKPRRHTRYVLRRRTRLFSSQRRMRFLSALLTPVCLREKLSFTILSRRGSRLTESIPRRGEQPAP